MEITFQHRHENKLLDTDMETCLQTQVGKHAFRHGRINKLSDTGMKTGFLTRYKTDSDADMETISPTHVWK